MSVKTKAVLFNLVCFIILYFSFRFLIGSIFEMSRFILSLLAAIWASILTPKFLVKDGILWIKLPFISKPKKF